MIIRFKEIINDKELDLEFTSKSIETHSYLGDNPELVRLIIDSARLAIQSYHHALKK